MYDDIDEDYYRQIKINNAFNDDYIEYESNRDKDKILSVKKYLDVIKQYLSDIINNHKTQNESKIQLSLAINFVFLKDFKETRTVYTSDNIDIMIGNETDKITEKHTESVLERYQEGLEEKMKGSEFDYDSTDLLHYKLYKISLNRGGSNVDSLEWLKNKRASINTKNHDGQCFQYAITVALTYPNIDNHPERVNNINHFLDKYNWKEIDFPSHKKGWKKFQSNNMLIAHNVLYVPHNS